MDMMKQIYGTFGGMQVYKDDTEEEHHDIQQVDSFLPIHTISRESQTGKEGITFQVETEEPYLFKRMRDKERINLQAKANLNLKGDGAISNGEFEEAAKWYSHSLNIWEDQRSYVSRSLCFINMSRSILLQHKDTKSYPHDAYFYGSRACRDAEEAMDLDHTYVKAHYCYALGCILCRDLYKAKKALRKGLKYCPNNKLLWKLLNMLKSVDLKDMQKTVIQLWGYHIAKFIANERNLKTILKLTDVNMADMNKSSDSNEIFGRYPYSIFKKQGFTFQCI